MDLSQVTNLGTLAWTWAAAFVPRLIAALVIFVAGFYLAGLAATGVRKLAARARSVDPTIVPVLAAAVRYGIIIFVVIAALGQAGIETTSVLAVLGAAGLALGLALQGTLSNIAAGIMLLWLRPFRVGDAIEASGVAGTAEEISLFHTRLKTADGIFKFVPNALLWNTTLTNYTRNRTRMVQINFVVSYGDDIGAARKVLAALGAAHPDVLKDPPVDVVPLAISESSVTLQLRAWTSTAKFGNVQAELTEGGKKALEKAGLQTPYPHQILHWVPGETPPETRAS
jgi:small conductance mechanosensitive channel